MIRLAVWSGPRSISTALMRSWENRGDTVVVDEPLYPHYLATTGLDHPGRDEVIAAGPTDWRSAVDGLVGPLPSGVAVHYQKHMAHHLLPDIERAWIAGLTNVLLIRDPRHVVASYVRTRAEVSADDLGYAQQIELYDAVAPLVIDSGDLLADPERYLRSWCARLEVPFTDRMLSWPPGPRASDGVWAPHWYDAVWRSTGFGPPRSGSEPVALGADAAAVVEQCLPAYEALHEVRWRP